MSDFDKFFADKLDEESQFPRREKNWRTLSKRLDAFDSGLELNSGSIHRYLRYWQAVAACFVIATGLLTWKLLDVKNENTGLQNELAVLEGENSACEQEIALLKESALHKKSADTNLAGRGENDAQLKPSIQSLEMNERRKSTSIHHAANQSSAVTTDQTGNAQSVAIDNPNASIPTFSEGILPLSHPANLPDSLTTSVAALSNPPDSILLPVDSTLGAIAEVRPDSSRQSPAVPKRDTVFIAASPKIIEPVRNPSRFRAGIQVLAGISLPKEKGVSTLIGQGITAEYNVWRSFWLAASADWLHFDVATEKYIPKFHSHHHHQPPHGGGGPQEKLVKVESTQRQQHYGLGLRYSLPVRTWIRPAVRVTYSMIHTSPELITFTFEKKGGPGGPPGPPKPKYAVQKTESQLIENVWRFGAGLEHETPIWSFGLWADYSKNFAASDLTFDALTFRAGIQYKFN